MHGGRASVSVRWIKCSMQLNVVCNCSTWRAWCEEVRRVWTVIHSHGKRFASMEFNRFFQSNVFYFVFVWPMVCIERKHRWIRKDFFGTENIAWQKHVYWIGKVIKLLIDLSFRLPKLISLEIMKIVKILISKKFREFHFDDSTGEIDWSTRILWSFNLCMAETKYAKLKTYAPFCGECSVSKQHGRSRCCTCNWPIYTKTSCSICSRW